MLPHHDRVTAQTDFILLRPMGRIVKKPATVAVPEALGHVVGIFYLISLGMMADMVAAPLKGRVLQRPTAGDKDAGLDPIGAFEALM